MWASCFETGGLLCDLYRFGEGFLVELAGGDADGFFHELRAAPALEKQAEVFGVFGWHLEGFVQAAFGVEVGKVNPCVVPVVATALEENPSVV